MEKSKNLKVESQKSRNRKVQKSINLEVKELEMATIENWIKKRLNDRKFESRKVKNRQKGNSKN